MPRSKKGKGPKKMSKTLHEIDSGKKMLRPLRKTTAEKSAQEFEKKI